MKIVPKLVLEFEKGIGKKPTVYPVCDTDEEAAQLKRYAERLENQRENKKETNDK